MASPTEQTGNAAASVEPTASTSSEVVEDVTVVASPARRGAFSNIPSVIPTPDRERIAGITSWRSYEYYDCDVTLDDGIVHHKFKPVPPFTIHVPTETVQKIIEVNETKASWKKQSGGRRNETSDIFRNWMLPHLPPHIALTFNRQVEFLFMEDSTVSKKRKGPKRKPGSIAIGYNEMYCTARSMGCPTTLTVGFTDESIKSLLETSVPEMIELSVNVSNACLHKKGHEYGRLAGTARGDIIEEFGNAKKMPAEFVKNKLDGATDVEEKLMNRQRVPSREQAYNLSRQAKAKQRVDKGLTGDSITNVYLAAEKTRGDDLQERKRREDDSNDIVGMLRSFQLYPHYDMNMWDKRSLLLFHYMCKTGQLILSIDATGNLLDVKEVPDMKGKLLHTRIAVSPKYALITDQYMQDKAVNRMLSPLVMAERVSNKNTVVEMTTFFKSFLKDAEAVIPQETTGRPLLLTTDCSPALQSAALAAFSPAGRESTLSRMEYGNVMLIHLLHYDKLISDIKSGNSSMSRKDAATALLKSLREQYRIGILAKECKSHVYRAVRDWMHKQKGPEFAAKARLEEVFKGFIVQLLEENRISVVFVKLCLVVAMLQTERFSISEQFGSSTEVKEHRGPQETAMEQQMTQNVANFIEEESQKLHIATLHEVQSRLGDGTNYRRRHISVHHDIVNRAMALIKNQCCAYLTTITHSNNDSMQSMTGLLRFSIIYGIDPVTDDGSIEPWKQGGLGVSVKLPFNGFEGDSIKNPLYSPAAATYLLTTWMHKVSLWSRGVIDVLDTAMDMTIEDSNQLSEAMTKNQKYNQEVFEHVSEPAEYLLHRADDSRKSCKHFVQQLNSLPGKIEKMEIRRANKRARKEDAGPVNLTQDEQMQEREENVGEQWSRRGSGNEQDSTLRNDLNAIFATKGLTSDTTRHASLAAFGAEHDPPLPTISYSKFHTFMANPHKSAKPLNNNHRRLVVAFRDHELAASVREQELSLTTTDINMVGV